jgi:hypothetical protein
MAAALWAGALAGQEAGPRTRPVESRQALRPDAPVRIWAPDGVVRVTAWDLDSLVVTGRVPARYRFVCGGSYRGAKCSMDDPTMTDDGVGATLDVRVPRRAQLWIKTNGADIEIADHAGDLEAYSVSGSIRVAGAGRVIGVETMSGDVVVSASAMTLRARTATGAMTLTGGAEDAQVSTVSGDLAIRGGGFRRGRFESVEGSITWEGPIPAAASLDFVNHSGGVELRLPADAAAEFLVNTYQGALRNAFGGPGLSPSPEGGGREASFDVGGYNGARVSIRVFKGPVVIGKQP